MVRTIELFGRFAAHYGFAYSFYNPNSGHERGSVESEAGFIRRSLFVPVLRSTGVEAFNENLHAKCMGLSAKGHWIKGESERRLFMEDRLTFRGLPSKPFEVVRSVKAIADKKDKVRVNCPPPISWIGK